MVVNLKKRQCKDRVSALETFYVLDCLLPTHGSAKEIEGPSTSTATQSQAAVAEVLPVRLDCVCGISAVRLVVPKDLRSSEARAQLYASIEKVKTKLGTDDLPPLDPVRDMHITDAKFQELSKVSILDIPLR